MKNQDSRDPEMNDQTTQKTSTQKHKVDRVTDRTSRAGQSESDRSRHPRRGTSHRPTKGKYPKQSDAPQYEKRDYKNVDLATVSIAELNQYARRLGI